MTIPKDEWNKADSVFVFTFDTSDWDLPTTIGKERDDAPAAVTSFTITQPAEAEGLKLTLTAVSDVSNLKVGEEVRIGVTITGTSTSTNGTKLPVSSLGGSTGSWDANTKIGEGFTWNATGDLVAVKGVTVSGYCEFVFTAEATNTVTITPANNA